MSNMDNILEKIKSDAQKQADQILADATAYREALIDEKKAEAQTEADRLISQAESEVDSIQSRYGTRVEREARDEVLQAKEDLSNRIFEQAKEKLAHLDQKDFSEILDQVLANLQVAEGSVLEIPENYTYSPSNPALKVVKTADVTSGFRITKDGIRSNYEFSELTDYLRDGLEAEVLRLTTKG